MQALGYWQSEISAASTASAAFGVVSSYLFSQQPHFAFLVTDWLVGVAGSTREGTPPKSMSGGTNAEYKKTVEQS